MGGNALQLVSSCRLQKGEYGVLQEVVLEKLHTAFPQSKFELIPSYTTKEDFGDMDILYTPSASEMSKRLAEIFPLTEIIKNGSVWSLGLKLHGDRVFQIDLIKTQTLDFSYVYFAYNDLGNLMGRIAKMLGFSYGHDGLWYAVRSKDNDSHVLENVLVTTDLNVAFRLIGYSFSEWLFNHQNGGFETIEDIYRFTTSAISFNPHVYLLENRAHHDRVRDRKRKTYMGFLEWLKVGYAKELKQPDITKEELLEYRKRVLENVFRVLPEFKETVDRLHSRHAIQKKAKENFRIEMVKEVTDATGKQIGIILATFKKPWVGINPAHFDHWCATVPAEEIEKIFKDWWAKASKENTEMLEQLQFHANNAKKGEKS